MRRHSPLSRRRTRAIRSPPTKAHPRPQLRDRRSPSCGFPHGSGLALHVADFHPGADRALAAVLEGDLSRNVSILGAVIERLDQWSISLGDEPATHFLSAGKL